MLKYVLIMSATHTHTMHCISTFHLWWHVYVIINITVMKPYTLKLKHCRLFSWRHVLTDEFMRESETPVLTQRWDTRLSVFVWVFGWDYVTVWYDMFSNNFKLCHYSLKTHSMWVVSHGLLVSSWFIWFRVLDSYCGLKFLEAWRNFLMVMSVKNLVKRVSKLGRQFL